MNVCERKALDTCASPMAAEENFVGQFHVFIQREDSNTKQEEMAPKEPVKVCHVALFPLFWARG